MTSVTPTPQEDPVEASRRLREQAEASRRRLGPVVDALAQQRAAMRRAVRTAQDYLKAAEPVETEKDAEGR